MENLESYVRRGRAASVEERLELIRALWRFLCEGRLPARVSVSPRNLLLEGGRFQLDAVAGSQWTCAAPEVLFSGAAEDRESRLFSLGLMIYFICTGQSYFEATQTSILLDMRARLAEDGALVTRAPAEGPLPGGLGEVARLLTSGERLERARGEELLREKLAGSAVVEYFCEGSLIGSERLRVDWEIARYPEGERFRFDGREYRVRVPARIPSRVGERRYRVELSPLEAWDIEPPRAGQGVHKLYLRLNGRLRRIFTLGDADAREDVTIERLTEPELEFMEYYSESADGMGGRRGSHSFPLRLDADGRLPLKLMLFWESERGYLHLQVLDRDGGAVVHHQMYDMRH